MPISIPELPFALGALAPHISATTLKYHYGKHHQGYVKKLNKTIKGTDLDALSLEDIILRHDESTFDNAAQIWNHSFYWNCLSPNGGGIPSGKLADAINASFGDVDTFQEAFTDAAMRNFGSGWTWLVKNAKGNLEIINTDDAETPLTEPDLSPLLTVDVWEHAYYIDYRNKRRAYLKAYWQLVNWEFAAANF